jgi:D-serine deaminase-like pyridoxal phosphate-dependent protein
MVRLAGFATALRDAGHAIEIVSAGGTNTHDLTGPNPVVTELQAGTYALMDTAYHPYAPRFEPALGVLGTVVSRHGDRVVLDCGTKVVGTMDIAAMRVRRPGLALRELHEEHALLDVVEGAGPRRGDRVEVIAPYSGATANLNDAYHVVRDGRVVDTWPIVARGAGPADRMS